MSSHIQGAHRILPPLTILLQKCYKTVGFQYIHSKFTDNVN